MSTITTGKGHDSHNGLDYLYAYDTERDVAAFDYNDDHIDITVAGTWQPGKPVSDADIFHTVELSDHENGPRGEGHPFTLEHLVQLARPHFGRDA